MVSNCTCLLPRVGSLLITLALGLAGCGDSGQGASEPDSSSTGGATGATSSSSGSLTSGGSESGDTTQAPLPSLGSCDRGATPTMVVGGTVEQDTTWSGVVLVESDFAIHGATLTILPGTQILVAPGQGIHVSRNFAPGAILSRGSAQAPILFCGTVGVAGAWKGLRIGEAAVANSELAFVGIEDGGNEDHPALWLESSILVQELQINRAAADGVRAANFGAGSANLVVTGARRPVVLSSSEALNHFPRGGRLVGNTQDVVALSYQEFVGKQVMHRLDVPYLQTEDVVVEKNASWEIGPGVRYLVEVDKGLSTQSFGDAAIKFVGEAANPVVIEGVSPVPGSWKGLFVHSSTSSDSLLKFVTIRHAGVDNHRALDIGRKILVQDVSIEDAQTGYHIGSDGLAPSSMRLSAKNIARYPISAAPQALLTLPFDGSFSGNSQNHIRVIEGTITRTGTIPKPPMPYRVAGNMTISQGAQVTLTPGTVFEIDVDVELVVGDNGDRSTLKAIGTASEPILFRGSNPVPGHWRGIAMRFQTASDTRFRFVHISDAGGSGDHGLLDIYEPIHVNDCRFSNSSAWAIGKWNSIERDYLPTNQFENIAGETLHEL